MTMLAAMLATLGGSPVLNAVDWGNISDTSDEFGSSATTTTEVVDGNTKDIYLKITWTGSPSSVTITIDGSPTLLSSGGTVLIASGGASSSGVSFTTTRLFTGTSSGTITVVNGTNGDAAVDTFTYSNTVT